MIRHIEYTKRSIFLLIRFWIAGLLTGIWTWYKTNDSLILLMRGAPWESESVIGIFFLTCFPFLISACLSSLCCNFLFYPICFFKGALLAFSSMLILSGFGSSAWLLCSLLLFRSWIGVPFLFDFWLRHLSGDSFCLWELVWLSLICILLGSLDYWIISPFLGRLVFF